MRWERGGLNRRVLLTKRYALKFPTWASYHAFLHGLINNMNEARWHRRHERYCPVLWAAPLGLCVVMPRVDILTDDEYAGIDWSAIRWPGCRVEAKASSWGRWNGTIVAVDYGW